MVMETRKLQQVGGGTYTVSIPKDWAVEHGLEAGSEVHLYAHTDGSIVVRSSEKDGEELGTVRVDIDGEDPEIVSRALRAAHAVGYETVTLRPNASFTDEQCRAARQTKHHLVGTEVVVEGGDEITLQNLLDASDVSVRQAVVQLQFVASSAHRQATAAFGDAEGIDLERLRERAEEADRLFEMITRHFSRSMISLAEVDRLGIDRPQLFDYYATARELVRVAELGVSVGRAVDERSGSFPDGLAADLETAADAAGRLVEEAATAVLEGSDVLTAHDVLDGRNEVTAALDAISQSVFEDSDAPVEGTPNDTRALTRILDALALTADHAGVIADVAIRAATRAESI